MRKVLERFLIADKSLSLYAADKPVFLETANGYGLNAVLDNQIVIYDAKTGVSVGPTVTFQDTPELVIAQGIDTDGDGIANVLRKPAFDKLQGLGVNAVTTELPSCGAIKILDVGIGCVERGKPYSLTIEVRDDEVNSMYPYNEFQRHTETVFFNWDDCGDCDQPVDCKEVACALANKFMGKDVNSPVKRNNPLIKKIRAHQAIDRKFDVYPLHAFDKEYCFPVGTTACKGCDNISAITGFIHDGVTHTFTLTTDPADETKSKLGQVKRVVDFINEVLHANNEGHAVQADTYIGSAKPCCDTVKILVNSCKDFSLLGDNAAVITPCATGLPTYEVQTQGECGGCSNVTTTTPCAYLRVIPKPISLEKYCDGPSEYLKQLYTDVRVSTSANHNNFGFFKVFTKQNYSLPRNLGYQLLHEVMYQDTSGNQPFSDGYNEYYGKYMKRLGTSRISAMAHGLLGGADIDTAFASIDIEHSNLSSGTEVMGKTYNPRVRTTLYIPNSNTALKTEIVPLLNSWLASIPNKNFEPISLTVDQDQIERVITAGEVTTEAYPNTNGTIIGG